MLIFCLASQVKQSYLIAPHESHFQIVHHILKEHVSQTPDYKVNAFCVLVFELHCDAIYDFNW